MLVLAAASVGCKTAADNESPDSPGSSIAGTEARRGDRTSEVRSAGQNPTRSLVAVTGVGSHDAQPCERVCGSLGDCLLAAADYTNTVAGGLELECLNMCVHAPDTARTKAEFLACGAQTECGSLRACAAQHWAALAEVRKGPEIAGVTGGGRKDVCAIGCRWQTSCHYTGTPNGALPIEVEREVEKCISSCEGGSPSDHSSWVKWVACIDVNECELQRAYQCYDSGY